MVYLAKLKIIYPNKTISVITSYSAIEKTNFYIIRIEKDFDSIFHTEEQMAAFVEELWQQYLDKIPGYRNSAFDKIKISGNLFVKDIVPNADQ